MSQFEAPTPSLRLLAPSEATNCLTQEIRVKNEFYGADTPVLRITTKAKTMNQASSLKKIDAVVFLE